MTDTPDSAAPPNDPRPQPPREPEPDECCNSGCIPCIYDHYWDALARYEKALKAWEARHAGTGS